MALKNYQLFPSFCYFAQFPYFLHLCVFLRFIIGHPSFRKSSGPKLPQVYSHCALVGKRPSFRKSSWPKLPGIFGAISPLLPQSVPSLPILRNYLDWPKVLSCLWIHQTQFLNGPLEVYCCIPPLPSAIDMLCLLPLKALNALKIQDRKGFIS